MAVTLASLRQRIKDKYKLETLSNPEIDRWIADTVASVYSFYNPVRMTDTVTSEAGEDTYDLPDDCFRLTKVLYNNTLNAGLLSIADLSERGAHPKEQPSLLVIDRINNGLGVRQPWEMWKQDGLTVIFEDSFAASGEEMTIYYDALHVLDSGTYDTIPAEDAPLIVDLVFADILEARAANASATEAFAEGSGRFDPSHIARSSAYTISQLRAKFFRKYTGAAGAML